MSSTYLDMTVLQTIERHQTAMSIKDKPNSGNPESSVSEILKKLSTTQRLLAERLKALGIKLDGEKENTPQVKEEVKEEKKVDKDRPKS